MSPLQIAAVAIGVPMAMVGMITFYIGIFLSLEMLRLVDAHRPEDDKRLNQVLGHWGLRTEYRSLYPEGGLDHLSARSLWIGIPLFLLGGLMVLYGLGTWR